MIDYEVLRVIWWVLVGVLLIGFAFVPTISANIFASWSCESFRNVDAAFARAGSLCASGAPSSVVTAASRALATSWAGGNG